MPQKNGQAQTAAPQTAKARKHKHKPRKSSAGDVLLIPVYLTNTHHYRVLYKCDRTNGRSAVDGFVVRVAFGPTAEGPRWESPGRPATARCRAMQGRESRASRAAERPPSLPPSSCLASLARMVKAM